MTADNRVFSVGSKFKISEVAYTVISFNGSSISARSASGKVQHFELSSLFTTPGFFFKHHLDDDIEKFSLEGLSDSAINDAKDLAKHILEVITGYKSGTKEDALENEPKTQYDPSIFSLTQRITNKAKELNKKDRAIWQMKCNYQKFGIAGLIDKRSIRQKGTKVDARVRQALNLVIDELGNKSNSNKKILNRLTKKRLQELYKDAEISFPSESTFNRLVDELAKGKRLFGPAKQRRSNLNRPATPYSQFHTSRPGELIVIDSTPLDAFAMDPYSFKWVALQLTIAIDLYSRSLVAWRFTPVSTKAVDAAFLLYDILRVKPLRSDWAPDLRWAYAGVPENILIELAGDSDHPTEVAAIPFLHPESVLVDRGSIFLSETFMAACRQLGINLMICRPHTPTDKAHIERLFRTIRENFVANLPGYKGPDVYSRGLDVELDAYWFMDEIEEKFAEWVCSWYQNREHQGLDLPELPMLKLSPNQMLEEGLARAGFVNAPPHADLYYFLLPTAWRTIQHYGVEIDLRYDGDILNDFRNQISPYGGKYAGKWPFRFDPRDRSAIYFMDPEMQKWHTLKWRGNNRNFRAFSEKTLSYAKSLVIVKGLDSSSHKDLDTVLEDFLNRMDNQHLSGNKERRIAVRQAMDAANAAKDRSLTPPTIEALTVISELSSEYEDENENAAARSVQFQLRDSKHIVDGAFRTTDKADEDEDDDLII